MRERMDQADRKAVADVPVCRMHGSESNFPAGCAGG